MSYTRSKNPSRSIRTSSSAPQMRQLCQARLSLRQLYLAQLSHMLLIGDDDLRVFRGHEGLHANRGTQVALHELSELVDGRLAVVSALRLNTLDDKERIA